MFKWLSPLLGFLYIILGITVIIYKFFVVFLDDAAAYALGPLLIGYGIFRVVRGVYYIKSDRDEE